MNYSLNLYFEKVFIISTSISNKIVSGKKEITRVLNLNGVK